MQRESQYEKKKTGDANTQKCEKKINGLECDLSGSVVVFETPKLLLKEAEAYTTKEYGEAIGA